MDKRSLQELLHYMSRTVPENACNAKPREIQRYVDELKQDSWIEEVYVTLGEYIEDEVRHAGWRTLVFALVPENITGKRVKES